MHWRAVSVVAIAVLVLLLRLANAYAVFGPHVSRVPEDWSVRLVDGELAVAGLSGAGGAASAAANAGLRDGDVIREVHSVRGGGPVRTLEDFERARYTVHRGESWTVTVERPSRERYSVMLPTVPTGFLPGNYASWLEGLWFILIIPVAALATACLLGLGKPTSNQAFVGALMFLAFATFWEQYRNYMSPALRGSAAVAWSIGYGYIFYLILHFFFIFPERSVIDRRLPWLRPGLLAAVTVYFAGRIGQPLAAPFAPGLARAFGATADALAFVPSVSFWAVALGLVAAAVSYWQATTRDAQRRIGILLVATALMSVVFLPSALRERLPVLGSDWARLAYGAMGFLFPAAFAYVVLKDRVFGIAVIVRQGVKYALVSRGFLLVESVLLFVAFLYLGARLLRSLDASASNLAFLAGTAVATLAIGAAVTSVNAKVMARVDRRFFRDAYDAARILTDLASSIRRLIVEPDTLVKTTVEQIVEALHVERVAVLLFDRRAGTLRIGCAHGIDVVTPENPLSLAADLPFARYVDALDEPRDLFAASAREEIDRLLATGGDAMTRSAAGALAAINLRLLVPLRTEGKVTGALALGEKRSEEPYSSDDKLLLQSIADQMAIALRQSELIAQVLDQEKLRRDIEVAKRVQDHLLPQAEPSIASLDLVAACRQARDIGGDYYDFLTLGDGKIALAIGDISGKGVSAALLMASLQALLRSRAPLRHDDPSMLIADVNALLYASTAGNKYATLFYAVYDDRTRTLTYVNAGHVAPLVLRRNGGGEPGLERLATGGTVVGLFPDAAFEQAVVTLHPGDVLIAFTDGVSEAMNADEEELGEARLAELLRGSPGQNATQIRDDIYAGTQAFVGTAPQHDDLTLLVARVREVPVA